jgi:hypothetical protein
MQVGADTNGAANAMATNLQARLLAGSNVAITTNTSAGTLTISSTGGSGGSFNPTNITLWAFNNLAGVQPGILTLAVAPLGTNTQGGVVLTKYQSIYSNAAYNGVWRSANNNVTNTYGDLQWDNTWNLGFNYNDGDGSPICTNQSQWVHQVESCWQNYIGVSQMEDWYGWGTPYTAYGTNFSWRFQGGTLMWNTTTHAYAGSTWGFSVDNFYLNDIYGNTVLQVNSIANPSDPSGVGAGAMVMHGPLTIETNWDNNSSISLHGAPVNFQTATGGHTVEAAMYSSSQNWFPLPYDIQPNSTNINCEFANFGQMGLFNATLITPGMGDGGTTVALKVGPQYYQSTQTADLQEWCGKWTYAPGSGPVLAAVDPNGNYRGASATLTNGVTSLSSNLLAPASITVSGSPFNWTNCFGKNVFVFLDLSGATNTSVKVNGAQIFGAATGTAVIPLQPNEYTTVTYSSGMPAMTWKPL